MVNPAGGGDASPCETVVAHSDLGEALVLHCGVHPGPIFLARHDLDEELVDVRGEKVKERGFESETVALALGAGHEEVVEHCANELAEVIVLPRLSHPTVAAVGVRRRSVAARAAGTVAEWCLTKR